MSFRLRLSDIGSIGADIKNPFKWDIEAKTSLRCERLTLHDPLGQSVEINEQSEKALKWFMESYASEPFEKTRADLATEILANYGRVLAAQIVKTGLLPKIGSIRLEIASKEPRAENSLNCKESTLQRLHWEVLEDARLWPTEYSFNSISIIRSVLRDSGDDDIIDAGRFKGKKFNILLAVSRPGKQKDMDYQLVSRSLVAIVEHVNKLRPDSKVSLTILRPPTWSAFKQELQDHDYDLVHFDMKGSVQKDSKGHTSAGLEFCKPDPINSLKMKRNFRTGVEIGKELAQAGVKTIILNACDSATFEASSAESNLAEVLLRYGTQHVLAMAYKIVEEAVEIFMNAFYQSLLIKKASAEEASRIARLALINNRQRRAMLMYNVNLSDYIVPVFYTSVNISSPLIKTEDIKYGNTISSYLDQALNSIKHLSPFERPIIAPLDSSDQALIGRDIDILSLEFLLSTSRQILLHGQGGCGKTEFLRYVCQWWHSSGWIKGSVYIDFGDDHFFSWEDYIEQMCAQLGIGPGECSEAAIIDRLSCGRYLLVFDSADAFESPLRLERPFHMEGMAASLRSLLDRATNDESMAIIASRLDTTSIANITSERQKFHLPGLSILDSVVLLERLTFDANTKPPELYHRRDNVDFLRRVAILLEGNPTAIQMIVPAFERFNYDGEALFNNLLYDVIENPSEENWNRSRFCKSVSFAMILPSFIDFDETLISATQFAPFWNLMPKDLTIYYWFFYLFASKYYQEAAYANWISKEWQDIVNNSRMARSLKTHWSDIESKLIRVGILQHAVVTRRDVYTLLSRSTMNKAAWKEARFAHIRQVLLWKPRIRGESYQNEWISVSWDGMEQNEDYLHNKTAQAIGWALQDGDHEEQVQRMGVTMFSLHYSHSVGSWWTRPRHRRLLIPLIRKYLSYVHDITKTRPASVPTSWDLSCIMNYSWTLYQIEADDTIQSSKAPIVKSALEVADTWKAHSPPGQSLSSYDEVTWFQLRFAEASTTERSLRLQEAKELFERNLRDDPATTNTEMLNIIRRWHLQNLQNWAACVIRLAVRDGRIKKEDFDSSMQTMSNFMKPKGMVAAITEVFSQHAEEIENLKTGEHLAAALSLEKEAASKFGSFAKSIINSPMFDVFADLKDEIGTSLLKFASQMLESKNPDFDARTKLNDMESGLHMMAGDSAAAERVMNYSLQREAPSSTSSTGWESLAELHMFQYGIAMKSPDKPDYKKGLAHLQEWWKLHQGVSMWKQDQVWGLLKLATCYHGVGQIVEAAREIIKCIEIGQGMGPTDCMDGKVENAHRHIYQEVVKLHQLDVFLDANVLFSRSPAIAALSLKERLQLSQIMKTAHEVKRADDELEELFEEMQKAFAPLGVDLGGEKDISRLEDGGRTSKGADNSWLF
ncbi:hypothetical protein N431DRAFT_452391 [Stipitochalara longipes BDJ]|nr:hypothetical protein N431DRAFT_452391 [Stipitochalara longipes BDJ]